MYKYVLFTHNDMDGAGCRIVFHLAHRNALVGDMLIEHCTYKDIDEKVQARLEEMNPEETELVFADITPSMMTAMKLKELGFTVRIFDHHVTAYPLQQVFPDAVIVPENELGIMQSGTSLIYQYYSKLGWIEAWIDPHKEGLLAELVDTIRAYDTYEWKETDNLKAKRLQTMFFMLGMERFVDKYMLRIISEYPSDLILDTELEFIDARIDREKEIIANFSVDDLVTLESGGYKIALVIYSKGASISELACEFLAKNPDYDFMVGFSLAQYGKLELRSATDEIDVSKIAQKLGGGGHRRASGANLPSYIYSGIVEGIADLLDDALNSDE